MLRAFAIRPNGRLEPTDAQFLPESVFGTSPARRLPLGLQVHPTAPVLYVGFVTFNTLGVYTFSPQGALRFEGSLTPAGDGICWFVTDAAVITERFTMFERNSLLWEITIDDPLVYTRPFTMASALRRNTREGFEIWEESCYEGEANSNHLRNLGYRTYPGISSKEAQALKDAFERAAATGSSR